MKKYVLAHRKEVGIVAGVLLTLWLYDALVIGGTKEQIAQLAREIEEQERILPRVRDLERSVVRIQEYTREIQEVPLQGGELAAAVERIKDSLNLATKMRRLGRETPAVLDRNTQVEEVTVTFVDLDLNDLVKFLQALESLGPSIRVRSARIQKQREKAILEMSIQAVRLKA